MKLKTRVLSAFLAILFFLSAISVCVVFETSAANAAEIQQKYVRTKKYTSPQNKLEDMELILTKYGYRLYANEETGEIAIEEVANPKNVLFTNPYDVASSSASDGANTNGNSTYIKEQLLSQVIVSYSETSKDQTKELYSFAEAAMRSQIELSRIRNGARMEYVIGLEETRKLVPRWIPKESFESNIIAPIREAAAGLEEGSTAQRQVLRVVEKFFAYYQEHGLELELTEATRASLVQTYPILEDPTVRIYVLDTNVSPKELSDLEGWIKDYCMDTYSFEQMDADHEATGYEAKDEEYPVFKLALEYTLTEKGLSVRMSCNGLQYNMASYHLENIYINPYMGAGNTDYPGYNFFPDGSGSLFDYQQLRSKAESVSAKIYGLDFAYHEITGATYQKTIRMPVYGSVSTEVLYSYVDKETGQTVTVSDAVKTKEDIIKNGYKESQITTDTYKRGYVAVIESGESLGRLQTYHLGQQGEYATIMTYFNPKPKDSYDLADSISVTSSSKWTVVSDRKFTGNIRILYQMLTDADDGAALRAADGTYSYYEASWLGMAEAYRDYLIDSKALTKLTEDDVTSSIPLYLEVFGALETQTTIATIPVEVMTPLTTFENILTMYNELAANGIRNINFKMTGFANGGMFAVMPSKVKWESKVGGASGFRELIEKAKEINADGDANLGLYPDFDFAYAERDTLTDSLNAKKDLIKTIDNRYSSKRIYSATKQSYVSYFQLAISPSRYSKFYTKLLANYGQYDINTMSVASLGSALNSDFDEDEPYNREDSKEFTVKAFADLSENYSLMTDSANAYSWAYVDHIINADIDSSRYTKSSASVPFLGVVLHGYLQFTGMPLNQEGDPEYTILKSVENGASIYFILSYQNTSELKKTLYLSKYYSINYSIWQDDLITYYNMLNDLLNDVQTKVIIDHKFLNYSDGFGTVRMLDIDELRTRISTELTTAEQTAAQEQRNAALQETAEIAEAMIAIRSAEGQLNDMLEEMTAQNETVRTDYYEVLSAINGFYDADDNGQDITNPASRIRLAVSNALESYSKLIYQYNEIRALLNGLKPKLAIICDAVDGDEIRQYQAEEATKIVNELLDETSGAGILALKEATAQLDFYQTYITNGKTFSNDIETQVAPIFAIINGSEKLDPIDFAELESASVYRPDENEAGNAGAEADSSEDITLVENNKVVAVTYGDVDEARNKTAYKTFILNYNNYTVRTVYGGQEYTIPAYGYVVFYY